MVLESLSRVAKEIGFDRVRPYVQENGSYKAMPDMPFFPNGRTPILPLIPRSRATPFPSTKCLLARRGAISVTVPMRNCRPQGWPWTRKTMSLSYTAPLDGKTTLENIYRTFNTDDRPADFRGHSLSVSDVVVINRGGKEEAHYCDSIGFTPVPEFMRESPIKTAEMSTEQNYNMIDGHPEQCPVDGGTGSQAKAGEQISLFDVAEAAKVETQKAEADPHDV